MMFINRLYLELLNPRNDIFSLLYPYITQQTDDEITQTYQVDVDILILRQILETILQGNI